MVNIKNDKQFSQKIKISELFDDKGEALPKYRDQYFLGEIYGLSLVGIKRVSSGLYGISDKGIFKVCYPSFFWRYDCCHIYVVINQFVDLDITIKDVDSRLSSEPSHETTSHQEQCNTILSEAFHSK